MRIICKGMWLLAAVLLLAASCVKQAEETVVPVPDFPKITATTFGSPASKVTMGEAVEGKRMLTWDKGDALSVFYRSSLPVKFVLEGEGGETTGIFSYAAGAGGGIEFPKVYATYPFESDVKYEDGALWVTVPPVQTYMAGGFDPKANVMVGVTDPGANLNFKNVGGYLVFQFWGKDAEVSKVTVSGAMGEYLAGQVLVGIKEDNDPSVKDWGEGSEEVSLVAKEPVKVGATEAEATEFWLVVMPQKLMDGFTVTVEWNGGTFSQTMDASYQVFRSTVNRLAPLELDSINPDDPIAFKDADLKAHLVKCGVDTDGDREISYAEAAAVTSFEGIFDCPPLIHSSDYQSPYAFTSFDEFAYFTGITELPQSQFMKWMKLKSITVPGSIKSLPNYAFLGCTALSSVTLNEGLTSIGVSCFYGCTALESISLPEGVTELNAQCFMESGIKSLTFPTTVTYVYGGICSYCAHLESLVVRGVKTIPGGAFGSMPALKSLTIDGVKNLGSGAFYGCPMMMSATLNEGLESIGNGSFSFISLQSLVVPASVTYLGTGSFSGCDALTSITLLAETPSPDYHSNFIVALPNPNCKIYVPAASVEAYKAHFNGSDGRVFPIE